jgi:hypothetical protein
VDAVERALRWLRDHQSPDGRWRADTYPCTRKPGAPCKGPGVNRGHSGSVDAGVSALALLAFMGQGNTHRHGRFKRTVRKGIKWLKAQQRKDGSVGFHEGGDHGGAYSQAIATMALCEAYGVSRDPGLRPAAQKALNFCLDAQNPNLGWRYGIRDGRNDTSVTGWYVLAIKAGKVAGLKVPQAAFEGARRWFERCTSSDGSVGYMSPGGGSSVLGGNDGKFEPNMTLTAVSVVCRLFTGEKASTDAIRKGARLIAEAPPEWTGKRLSFYYWYYGTYALYHFDQDNKWGVWNKAMKKALLPNQRNGGCEDGSWDGVGEWSTAGRVYATAINALTLQIYYRYERETVAMAFEPR